MITQLLDEALSLVIPCRMARDMNNSDLNNLMKSYAVIEQAKDAFLCQEITFEEYICLCEKHEVNVDSYMETIEHNLIQLRLI